jgi:DNA-binding NarL/FixJ family response regulator
MDVRMPGIDGIEATRRLVEHFVRATRAPEDASARLAALTVREREVLTLITRGRFNTEIAAELHLSESTVKTHVGRVLAKLDVRDRVHSVIAGYECGLARAPVPGETAPVPDLAASVTYDSAPVPSETR